ncbi:1-phosphofructokinase family hexose kinase [Leifsonia poae]|uniref:1-phosphofructokinase family hexose kinase n=1 Tax=Leifsonia poae TaxID=110933 RepID=UPI003D69F915
MEVESSARQALVITLTVNPALDISAMAPEVIPDHKLCCTGSRLDPGGGGINVARVVRRLGGRAVAVYTAGGTIGETCRRLVEQEHVPSVVVPVRGSTRASFSVGDADSGSQYRFVLEGPELGEAEWSELLDDAVQLAAPGDILVASGSLAPGVPTDFYARAARRARENDVLCVVDGTGPALAEALAEGVLLATPSRRELGAHLGRDLPDVTAAAAAALTLVDAGCARYVAVTLGPAGAVLAGPDGARFVAPPPVRARGTVGAGDAFVAGLVHRLASGRPAEQALVAGVAAGTAAVLAPGTGLGTVAEFERLEAAILREGAQRPCGCRRPVRSLSPWTKTSCGSSG